MNMRREIFICHPNLPAGSSVQSAKDWLLNQLKLIVVETCTATSVSKHGGSAQTLVRRAGVLRNLIQNLSSSLIEMSVDK